MKLNDYEAIIFDMDGTIINSLQEVMLCLEDAFEMENMNIDKSRLNHNIIGPPLDRIAKSVLPTLTDEQAKKIVDNYNLVYDGEKYFESKLYDGMLELLYSLKKCGKKLFIATNKPDFSTKRLIKKLNLTMFDDVYTLDMYSGRTISKKEMIAEIIEKYKLSKSKTIMIGDAPRDVIAAKENGIKSIGALWGYGDDKQPLIENSDFAINDVRELLSGLAEEVA